MTILLPFLVLIFFSFFFCWNRQQNQTFFVKRKMMITLSITLYSFNSLILRTFVQLIDCQNFEFGSYLRIYLIESCNDQRYHFYYYSIILPTIFIFAFILPVFTFFYIFKNRKFLEEFSMITKIGFIIMEYKQERYYW